MKKVYVAPSVEMISFESESVVSTIASGIATTNDLSGATSTITLESLF